MENLFNVDMEKVENLCGEWIKEEFEFMDNLIEFKIMEMEFDVVFSIKVNEEIVYETGMTLTHNSFQYENQCNDNISAIAHNRIYDKLRNKNIETLNEIIAEVDTKMDEILASY